MTDSLNSRVGRIVSGGLAALVGAVEGAAPEMVMEEAIREIESAIADVQAELGRAIAGRHLATKQLSEKNAAHEALAEKVALAVNAGKDHLAEAGIAAQLDIEAQIPVIEAAIANAGEQETELNGYIAALQAKRREMQGELKNFRDAQRNAARAAPAGAADHGTAAKAVNRAEQVFERLLDKHGAGSLVSRPEAKTAAQLAELDNLQRQNQIKERLAQAKGARKV